MAADKAPPWHVNPECPPDIRSVPPERLFSDPDLRRLHWLPQPPGPGTPTLRAFWDRLCTGITEYRQPVRIPPPCEDQRQLQFLLQSQSALSRSPDDWVRSIGGHLSNSANWAGSTTRASRGDTFTWMVGSWVEPEVARCGLNPAFQQFRSSTWIGFNGQAMHPDAALPQIGTMQQIVYDATAARWNTLHWVWYEWWANSKGSIPTQAVLPVYVNMQVTPGDTVLASVELIPGSGAPGAPPHVARMFMCIEHPGNGTPQDPPTKVLLLPFTVEPPEVDRRRVLVSGAVADWVTELPTSLDRDSPFLLPRFVDSTGAPPVEPFRFSFCAAGRAADIGQPIVAEQTLELSRRIQMVGRRLGEDGEVDLLATLPRQRPSETAFDILVHGNGGD